MKKKSKTRILIVDDNEAILKLLEFLLKMHFFDVETENNGLNAVERIKKESFDLVVCDIDMPQYSGLSVLKEACLLNLKTKIVMMTGNLHEDYYEQSMALGASGFLGKPFESQQLLKTIEDVLSK